MPAAPTPVMTTRTSSSRLPTTCSAFSSAARTTIAVPCWSSWKTGMSSRSRSRASISKQRGAEMSSRLIPPKTGAIALTAATISSGSVVSRQIGQASMPPNSLNSIALPSITGSAASRADVAQAEHRGAVGDDGDRVLLDRSGSRPCRDRRRSRGRRARRRACRPSRGRRASSAACFGTTSILPPRCIRKVRSETCSTSMPVELAHRLDDRGDVVLRPRRARPRRGSSCPSPPARGRSRRADRRPPRSRRRAPRRHPGGCPGARAASR